MGNSGAQHGQIQRKVSEISENKNEAVEELLARAGNLTKLEEYKDVWMKRQEHRRERKSEP